MGTQERKQREFDHREKQLLEAAIKLFTKKGAEGITMDALVAASEYSKGTVYKHFCCSEDVLAAICIDRMTVMQVLFRKALDYPGYTREKMLAAHMAHFLFNQNYPAECSSLLITKTLAVRAKINPYRSDLMVKIEHHLTGLLCNVVKQAVLDGDVTIPADMCEEILIFNNRALGFGIITLLDEYEVGRTIPGYKVKMGGTILFNAINHLLDGYGWRPLSSEWNYDKTLIQVKALLMEELQECVKSN